MKRKLIPAEESFRKWKKDPKYVAAYNALEKEFAIASAVIKPPHPSLSSTEPPVPSSPPV